MSLQLMARVGVSVLAMLAGTVVLGSQPQAPYYGLQTVRGATTRQGPMVQQGPSQHAPGEAYTVRV